MAIKSAFCFTLGWFFCIKAWRQQTASLGFVPLFSIFTDNALGSKIAGTGKIGDPDGAGADVCTDDVRIRYL